MMRVVDKFLIMLCTPWFLILFIALLSAFAAWCLGYGALGVVFGIGMCAAFLLLLVLEKVIDNHVV